MSNGPVKSLTFSFRGCTSSPSQRQGTGESHFENREGQPHSQLLSSHAYCRGYRSDCLLQARNQLRPPKCRRSQRLVDGRLHLRFVASQLLRNFHSTQNPPGPRSGFASLEKSPLASLNPAGIETLFRTLSRKQRRPFPSKIPRVRSPPPEHGYSGIIVLCRNSTMGVVPPSASSYSWHLLRNPFELCCCLFLSVLHLTHIGVS
jgi:hypothetical protein